MMLLSPSPFPTQTSPVSLLNKHNILQSPPSIHLHVIDPLLLNPTANTHPDDTTNPDKLTWSQLNPTPQPSPIVPYPDSDSTRFPHYLKQTQRGRERERRDRNSREPRPKEGFIARVLRIFFDNRRVLLLVFLSRFNFLLC